MVSSAIYPHIDPRRARGARLRLQCVRTFDPGLSVGEHERSDNLRRKPVLVQIHSQRMLIAWAAKHRDVRRRHKVSMRRPPPVPLANRIFRPGRPAAQPGTGSPGRNPGPLPGLHLASRRGAAYAVAAQAAFRALFGMPALSTLLLYGNYFTTDDDVQDSIASLAFLFAAGSAGVLLSAFITPGR
jgi:hypothetical protein